MWATRSHIIRQNQCRTFGHSKSIRHLVTVNIFIYYSQANFSCRSCIDLPSHSNGTKKQIREIHWFNTLFLRTKIVTKSKILGFYPIDAYCNRPTDFENMSFVSYSKIFETKRIQRPNSKCYRIDMFGFYLYETSILTRSNVQCRRIFFSIFFYAMFALEMKESLYQTKTQTKLYFIMLHAGATS